MLRRASTLQRRVLALVAFTAPSRPKRLSAAYSIHSARGCILRRVLRPSALPRARPLAPRVGVKTLLPHSWRCGLRDRCRAIACVLSDGVGATCTSPLHAPLSANLSRQLLLAASGVRFLSTAPLRSHWTRGRGVRAEGIVISRLGQIQHECCEALPPLFASAPTLCWATAVSFCGLFP